MATRVIREHATVATPPGREVLWEKIRSFLTVIATAYQRYSARRLDYLQRKYLINLSPSDRAIIDADLHGLNIDTGSLDASMDTAGFSKGTV